jgi:hypothetical protein
MGQDESLKVLPAPQIVRSHGEQKCRPRLQFPMLFTPFLCSASTVFFIPWARALRLVNTEN